MYSHRHVSLYFVYASSEDYDQSVSVQGLSETTLVVYVISAKISCAVKLYVLQAFVEYITYQKKHFCEEIKDSCTSYILISRVIRWYY